MKMNVPIIPAVEYHLRWRRAYHAIQDSWQDDLNRLAAQRKKGLLSYEQYTTQAGTALDVLDTLLLSGINSYEPVMALLLLENIADDVARHPPRVYYLNDNTKHHDNSIFSVMKQEILDDRWLSELLADKCGVVRTRNGIEVNEMPGGSCYVYWDHPGEAGKPAPVHVGVCEEYSSPKDLMRGLSCATWEALDQISGEDLLRLYAAGEVAFNAYIPDDHEPCTLLIRKENSVTRITHHEKRIEFVTETALDTVNAIIVFTQQYAAGLIKVTDISKEG